MLPSAPKSLGRLGEVLISALKSTLGQQNSLEFGARRSICVILVDGLGSSNLKQAGAHASFLNAQRSETAMCWFPATTATSIVGFATSTAPWQNGFLGYQVFDRASETPMNLLSGWSGYAAGENYQESQTISELAVDSGVEFHTVAPSAYESSGFTAATMRGSSFHGTDDIQNRFAKASQLLREPNSKIVYLYIPELDQLAHSKGAESLVWLNLLEEVDSQVRGFIESLPKIVGAILTADHGVVDVDKLNHLFIDEVIPVDSLQFVGGDTRSLFLYFKTDIDLHAQRKILEANFSDSCYVVTAAELVSAGYWQELSGKSLNVSPDFVLLARKRVALYHRGFAKKKSMEMVGHHGSITNEELAIPLIRFGF
jgi:hypothetical protein